MSGLSVNGANNRTCCQTIQKSAQRVIDCAKGSFHYVVKTVQKLGSKALSALSYLYKRGVSLSKTGLKSCGRAWSSFTKYLSKNKKTSLFAAGTIAIVSVAAVILYGCSEQQPTQTVAAQGLATAPAAPAAPAAGNATN